MPDNTLSQALKEAYAAAPSGCGDLSHARNQPSSFHVADLCGSRLSGFECAVGRRYAGYVPAIRVQSRQPEVSATGVPQCTVEIDNASRDILANVQLAMQSTDLITMTYREYLSSDLRAAERSAYDDGSIEYLG